MSLHAQTATTSSICAATRHAASRAQHSIRQNGVRPTLTARARRGEPRRPSTERRPNGVRMISTRGSARFAAMCSTPPGLEQSCLCSEACSLERARGGAPK